MESNHIKILIQRFLNAITLVLLIVLVPGIINAAPSSHANGQAKHHFNDETFPGNARSSRGNGEEWARGRILVMPRAGLPARALANILKEHEGKPRKVGQSDLYIVDVPEYTEEGVIAKLKHHPHLKFAEFDYLEQVQSTSSDTYFPNAWHLPKISAPAAWDNSQGAGVTIAILDTGVDGGHPDLVDRMEPGWNFYDNNSNTSDVYGHGTKVAGTAAATTNNGVGVASVAGQSRIMPIRISAPDGSAYSSTIASGLVYAADHGARVANISYGNQPMRSATINASNYMKGKDGLVVVSAGNAGIDEGFAPTTSMIPVSATASDDVKTSWSSYGNYVFMSAPGAGIWTTTNGGGYGAVSGTSFSSPVTAGVIALMMAANPTLKNTEIESMLFSTATDLGASGWDQFYGHGRVNAAAAVQAAVDSAPVIDREAPVVAILDPLTGATVSDLVPVDVDVTDNVGVVRAELWVNNTSVAVDTTEPFAFSWDSKGVANGAADLVVRAFDAAGNSTVSNVVSVNVDNYIPPVVKDTEPPVVNIINPVAGNVSGNVTITVNASDNSGANGISLYVYVDHNLIATGAGSTLSTSWNTRSRRIANGSSHIIGAMAVDAAGNTSETSVTVKVAK